MVASILQSLGVNLGSADEMVPPNRFNEAGYFENASAVALNDGFLKRNDLSWRTLPAIDNKKTLIGVEDYTAALKELSAKLGENGPWGVKDPRLSFLLPYWKTAGRPISAIVCIRRPEAAALSLTTRNELSVSYAAALWELYTLAALRNTRRMTRAVVVYEALLAHPKKTIEDLITSLPELAELDPSAGAIKAAVSRVRRDLDHSRPVNKKIMPPGVHDLYQRVASGNLGINKDDDAQGVSMEMVRLEAGHQAAKRMNGDAREQLATTTKELASEKATFARHTERLADIVSLIDPDKNAVANTDSMLAHLRTAARNIPGPASKAYAEEAVRELLRAKDERIEWSRLELNAMSARQQALLDKAAAAEIELVQLRAEHQHNRIARETDHDEIKRLNAEISRIIGERNQSQLDARERISELEKQLKELTSNYAASRAAIQEDTLSKAEHAELTRALKLSRARAEQLQTELSARVPSAPLKASAVALDQRLRRQLLVLNELLQTIDSLLSPKCGRFAIPVRQIRLQLTQARQVVDGEVAMTRR
jgi:hypothetical protein